MASLSSKAGIETTIPLLPGGSWKSEPTLPRRQPQTLEISSNPYPPQRDSFHDKKSLTCHVGPKRLSAEVFCYGLRRRKCHAWRPRRGWREACYHWDPVSHHIPVTVHSPWNRCIKQKLPAGSLGLCFQKPPCPGLNSPHFSFVSLSSVIGRVAVTPKRDEECGVPASSLPCRFSPCPPLPVSVCLSVVPVAGNTVAG